MKGSKHSKETEKSVENYTPSIAHFQRLLILGETLTSNIREFEFDEEYDIFGNLI